MFGWFKPKLAPEGPVQFTVSIEIAAAASDVYALINWADPRNAKRILGNQITELPGEDERYEIIFNGLEEHLFHIDVTDAVPNHSYAFRCVIEPAIGRMQSTHETYRLEPTGEDSCTLTLINETQFTPGMRERDFHCEVSAMLASSQSALEKLRIQAEHGLDASKAVENRLVL